MIQNIFSIKNSGRHKILTILGIKFKFKLKNNDKLILKELINLKSELKEHISNEIFIANFIQDMHKKTFTQFKNCNENKEIVIVATGPTMKDYIPIENAIHIGVNKAFKNDKIKFDYLFTIDNLVNKHYIEDFLNYPAKKFLGTNSAKNGRHSYVKTSTIPLKYNKYPDVYNYVSDYPRNLCYPEITNFGLMDFNSVVFNAIHFAVYTHPKKIYLVGCDCSNTGYFDNSKQNSKLPEDKLLKGWKIFKEFQKLYYPDIEIISINPVGLKSMFEDIYTEEKFSLEVK